MWFFSVEVFLVSRSPLDARREGNSNSINRTLSREWRDLEFGRVLRKESFNNSSTSFSTEFLLAREATQVNE